MHLYFKYISLCYMLCRLFHILNVLNIYIISQCDKNISNRYDTEFKALSTTEALRNP